MQEQYADILWFVFFKWRLLDQSLHPHIGQQYKGRTYEPSSDKAEEIQNNGRIVCLARSFEESNA